MTLPIFLTARWENLIMANYEVSPDILKKYLPAHTELDEWNGRHYVSLVGFMFLDTKVLGLKIPFHINFEEVNLRFYVRYKDERFSPAWKRGVVFIREIVPKRMIAFVANSLYGEKYLALPMKNLKTQTADTLSVEYSWKFDNQWNSIKVNAQNLPQSLQEGSEEQFITEHYWGYTQQANNQTSEYQVEHPSWEVYPTLSHEITCNFAALYGKEFEQLTSQTPTSVFLAKGSEISVRQGRKLNDLPKK
ncbi:MAG: DUF2071 domain-containing protein [Thermoflexibacter sp.]